VGGKLKKKKKKPGHQAKNEGGWRQRASLRGSRGGVFLSAVGLVERAEIRKYNQRSLNEAGVGSGGGGGGIDKSLPLGHGLGDCTAVTLYEHRGVGGVSCTINLGFKGQTLTGTKLGENINVTGSPPGGRLLTAVNRRSDQGWA